MKKIVLASLMAVLLVVMAACGSEDKDTKTETEKESANKEDTTITFGVTPWTSTIPPTAIAKLIIEDMGYSVEEVKADAGNVFVGLSRGDIDVFMDSWLPAHENHISKFEDTIEEIAISYDDVPTGLVVPTYMTDINSINDLAGNEELFNNEVFGLEEGASGATRLINEAIEGYGLDMTQVNSSEGGMLAQAKRAISAEKPVVFYGWRPHSMFKTFDLKVLEDEDNKFEISTIKVFANNGLKEKAPDVHAFLTNWGTTIEIVEEMIQTMDTDGTKAEVLAREWIENNQDKVNEMLGK
ncbi:glycine betaine ABC transporter substrate-binding protein [Sporosarcina siberiensis]|uniref:Glycine betaine ABC transporter substrate-binding protein n=1 Tax=Sporosarcina siberiensis TaxID=1365606 RepID=A0ABW4SHA4_9BACL